MRQDSGPATLAEVLWRDYGQAAIIRAAQLASIAISTGEISDCMIWSEVITLLEQRLEEAQVEGVTRH